MEEEFEASGGEWREYRIGDLFGNIVQGSRLTKADQIDGLLPFVMAGVTNTGVVRHIGNKMTIFPKNSLTIDIFGNVFYRNYEFSASDDVGVYWNDEEYSEHSMLFLASSIQKSLVGKFDFGNKLRSSKSHDLLVKLPTLNNKLAFSYMENYIKALEAERIETLEAERIETLEAYLTVTNLRDYHLTKNDEKVLDKFAKLSDTKSRVEESEVFQLSQVFNLSSSKKKFNANMIEFGGKFPYVARGDSNNGIRGYITESEEFLNPANTISFGQDTATMFYQKEPYFTGDKIKVLRTKEVELDRYKALYLITSLRKSFSTFSWGSSSFNEKVLKETDVKLPIKNNQIDYTFMSDFVRAVEKLVIKDLVIWADKKIAATKEVVAR
ncbi:restriction endonuclease subunit S [Streptococcus sp. 3874]|nr:restriction endonuclease subunit S [Streptococcus sp. 3874]